MKFEAGLAALDESISKDDANDFEKMAEILAKQKPNWEPGTKHGFERIFGKNRRQSCHLAITPSPMGGSWTKLLGGWIQSGDL